MSIKSYRQSLRKIIAEYNNKMAVPTGQGMTLKELNQFRSYINSVEKDARKVVKDKLEQEMYLFYLSLQCLTSISLVFYEEQKSSPPVFPVDWINEHGEPNPNFVIRNIIVQIVNYSLAIGTLIEDGLDSPARAILKTNNRLIGQLLVIMADRSIFQDYCQCETEEQSIKKWYSLFANGKLAAQIEIMEAKLGLPQQYLNDLKLWHREAQQFYYKSVLHSFSTIHTGAFSLDFDNDEMRSAILGSASATSIKTLEHINFQLWYCIVLFFKVLENINGFEVPLNNQLWYRASVCKECVMFLFLDTYHADN